MNIVRARVFEKMDENVEESFENEFLVISAVTMEIILNPEACLSDGEKCFGSYFRRQCSRCLSTRTGNSKSRSRRIYERTQIFAGNCYCNYPNGRKTSQNVL